MTSSNQPGETLPFPSLAAAQSVPLATLSFDEFVPSICGHLALFSPFTKTELKALAGFLSFLREHSNRLWPSQETIARRAQCGVRTVKRMFDKLRRLIGLAPIEGEELYAGHGPHNYEGETRSDRTVNTYDVSALVALLSRFAIEKLAARSPLARAQNKKPTEPPPARIDQTGLPNPLDDAAPDPKNPNPSEAVTARDGVPFSHAPAQALDPCNVPIEIAAPLNSDGPAVPLKNQKNAAAASALRPVLGPVLAYIDLNGNPLPGAAALRAFRPAMQEPQIAQIIERYGDGWAFMLAKYIAWMGGRGKYERKNFARVAFSTFKRIRDEGIDPATAFGETFGAWFDKEEKITAQIVQIDAKMREAKRRAKLTVAAPLPPNNGGSPPPEVLGRALQEVLSEMKGALKKSVEKQGAKHGMVQARALSIMARESEKEQ